MQGSWLPSERSDVEAYVEKLVDEVAADPSSCISAIGFPNSVPKTSCNRNRKEALDRLGNIVYCPQGITFPVEVLPGEFYKAYHDPTSNGRVTVKLQKALYGCVQSARAWYDHLSKFLTRIGFEANPVDPRVFNRMTADGKHQLTLAIHVDDGLATCADVEELNILEEQLKAEFNNEVDCVVDVPMNFLKGQGYDVSSTLMQDNTSTIRLAENGKSNSDRTRHIGVRYFFVKQYLEDGSMKMEHCPTKEMVADLHENKIIMTMITIMISLIYTSEGCV